MDFKTLQKKKYILLDGAMGTMLQKRGLKIGGIPEELNITNPDIVEEVHRLYIQAGSDIVYANTFGANGYKLQPFRIFGGNACVCRHTDCKESL